ncbi:MAG: aldo/keto reductase [Anaerolineae bacterium]|jgi:aryl-alcohol dehydrogenase-like predicted oxidoreductase
MSSIPFKLFGNTGHNSRRTLFGAAALGGVTQAETDQTMELLIQHGINHIDTAASYGESETRLGPWMARMRGDFFLASKTGERSYAAARDQIRRSLERLQTDHLDLIQLHNLVDEAEWEQAFGEDGALRAAIEAREEGLVRFIGVTGHGLMAPVMHKRSLERFNFDSVLLPYNFPLYQNPTYAANFEALVTLCVERNVAVQTIKSLTRRPWAEEGHHFAATWYEPLTEQSDIDSAVAWVLGDPRVFLNTTGDIHVLPKVWIAAERFESRPCDETMRALVARQDMAPLFT